MQTYENPDINPQQWTWTPGDFTHRYGQEFSYDANGNILTQTRLDHSGSSFGLIDDLEYHYQPGTNRLDYVTNQETGGGNNQVPDQDSDNYRYDGSGNLVEDCSELLSNISWNHFGKVTQIRKDLGDIHYVIEFEYDPNQQRVKKRYIKEDYTFQPGGGSLPEGGDPIDTLTEPYCTIQKMQWRGNLEEKLFRTIEPHYYYGGKRFIFNDCVNWAMYGVEVDSIAKDFYHRHKYSELQYHYE